MKGSILYGVLNWGLGHATRSKVLIDALLEANFAVTLASDGNALKWLRQEYPHLPYLNLPAYNVHYAKGQKQTLKLLHQLPKIAAAAAAENRVLKKYVAQNIVSGIISDNRLGFYHAQIPSVYLSHQLSIKIKYGAALAGWAHRYYIKKYQQCWVPDDAQHTLSGQLSQYSGAKLDLRFTGLLSRYSEVDKVETATLSPKILAVLSGPEPQRGILQAALLEQMAAWPQQEFQLVCGVKEIPTRVPKNVEAFGRLSSKELIKLLGAAHLVISRSGYSSLMDYAALGKKALLIPTPGQGEQEYLAQHLETYYGTVQQFELSLKSDCEKALAKPGLQLAANSAAQLLPLFGLLQGK